MRPFGKTPLGRVLSAPISLAALIATLVAAGASPGSQPSVESIVTKHVQALGGIDRIHAIHSIILRGWYHERDFRLKTFTARMRPFYRVIGDTRTEPLSDIHEGYDGSSWEYYQDPGIVVRTVGSAAAATRHSAAFDDVLVDYALHGTTLTYGGQVTVDGNRVDILHATLEDGFKEDVYVDLSTYMIDGLRRVVPMHAFGARFVTHDLFSDYRPEGGVMMSHLDQEIDSRTGKVLTDGGVSSIEINPDLPVSMFSPPQWQRSPTQEMIQRIYDERDEPASVIATYLDFRRAMDLTKVSTADAVDFVGYQCLKMGHADTAIRLLEANVADYPNSARAHFGLGRALAAAGLKARAAAEFRRALQLDPTFERARSALEALHSPQIKPQR